MKSAGSRCVGPSLDRACPRLFEGGSTTTRTLVVNSVPRGGANFTIFAEADIGDSVSNAPMAGVQDLIAAGLPRFVLVAGDLTHGNKNGQAAVDRHFNDVMAWSEDAAYMPGWGIHEWTYEVDDDLRNYKGRFDFPNPRTSPMAPATGCCGEDWYWFDYGNVRFINYPEPWNGTATWTAWRWMWKS
jgi:hypothetical protein